MPVAAISHTVHERTSGRVSGIGMTEKRWWCQEAFSGDAGVFGKRVIGGGLAFVEIGWVRRLLRPPMPS
jgi:hypothetical protein